MGMEMTNWYFFYLAVHNQSVKLHQNVVRLAQWFLPLPITCVDPGSIPGPGLQWTPVRYPDRAFSGRSIPGTGLVCALGFSVPTWLHGFSSHVLNWNFFTVFSTTSLCDVSMRMLCRLFTLDSDVLVITTWSSNSRSLDCPAFLPNHCNVVWDFFSSTYLSPNRF